MDSLTRIFYLQSKDRSFIKENWEEFTYPVQRLLKKIFYCYFYPNRVELDVQHKCSFVPRSYEQTQKFLVNCIDLYFSFLYGKVRPDFFEVMNKNLSRLSISQLSLMFNIFDKLLNIRIEDIDSNIFDITVACQKPVDLDKKWDISYPVIGVCEEYPFIYKVILSDLGVIYIPLNFKNTVSFNFLQERDVIKLRPFSREYSIKSFDFFVDTEGNSVLFDIHNGNDSKLKRIQKVKEISKCLKFKSPTYITVNDSYTLNTCKYIFDPHSTYRDGNTRTFLQISDF